MVQLSANAALSPSRTHFGLIFGRVPGKAASNVFNRVFGGSDSKEVDERENSFCRDFIWAWVSMPITTCQPSRTSRDIEYGNKKQETLAVNIHKSD